MKEIIVTVLLITVAIIFLSALMPTITDQWIASNASGQDTAKNMTGATGTVAALMPLVLLIIVIIAMLGFIGLKWKG